MKNIYGSVPARWFPDAIPAADPAVNRSISIGALPLQSADNPLNDLSPWKDASSVQTEFTVKGRLRQWRNTVPKWRPYGGTDGGGGGGGDGVGGGGGGGGVAGLRAAFGGASSAGGGGAFSGGLRVAFGGGAGGASSSAAAAAAAEGGLPSGDNTDEGSAATAPAVAAVPEPMLLPAAEMAHCKPTAASQQNVYGRGSSALEAFVVRISAVDFLCKPCCSPYSGSG